MDFFWLVAFLFLYYIRPHEWVSALNTFRPVMMVMIFALASLVLRPRGVKPGDLLRTPHDWCMLAWFVWAWSTSTDPGLIFRFTFTYIAFYFVTQQALNDLPRLLRFLKWWTWFVVVIAALALLSQVGIDPLGSHDLTTGKMKNRLSLNLSIFQNPNALGHNVVPALGMIYFVFVWKRMISRPLGMALLVVPALCIWQTLSKGAFVSAAAVILGTLTFGRPKLVQGAIIAVAMAVGGGVMYSLPRMDELKSTKTDAGIQGRVQAFKHGYHWVSETWTGTGFGNFIPTFVDEYGYNKASHSSYVQVGCELGWGGYFLTWAVMYCCLRTLVTARTRTVEEERARRLLFVILFSYIVSSWMVDLAYRPTWFVMAGAIAAFHRLLLNLEEKDAAERDLEENPAPAMPAWRLRFQPAGVTTLHEMARVEGGEAAHQSLPVAVLEPPPAEEAEPLPPPGIQGSWNRFGVVDVILTFAMVYASLRFWAYVMERM